jgi:hypothetical protein
MKDQLDPRYDDLRPAELSTSSAVSLGGSGRMEKRNSITSVESGVMTNDGSSVESNGPVVVPHMGLLSSCNMVRWYLLYNRTCHSN